MSSASLDLRTLVTVVIFVATYAGVALGRVPGLRIDRAGIARVGASLMIAFGTLSLLGRDAGRVSALESLASSGHVSQHGSSFGPHTRSGAANRRVIPLPLFILRPVVASFAKAAITRAGAARG